MSLTGNFGLTPLLHLITRAPNAGLDFSTGTDRRTATDVATACLIRPKSPPHIFVASESTRPRCSQKPNARWFCERRRHSIMSYWSVFAS